MAFLVVVQWGKYQDASSNVTKEANLVGDISRMAESLPSDQRKRVLVELRDYAVSVVSDEWPALATGSSSDKTSEALNRIWRSYVVDITPQTARENALYTESLRRLNDLSDSRRLRINASRDVVPPMLWILLIGGGVTTIGFTYFFGVKSSRAHVLMIVALTTEIAFILLLLVVLDNPFKGDLSAQPEPITEQIKHIGDRIEKGGF
jgi:hypothetical protein